MSGFIYIWRDRKYGRYYVGSHWGLPNDSYICSSNWMSQAYKRRPGDFKRRIISVITTTREDLLIEEQRWLDMVKPHEIKWPSKRYYNLNLKTNAYWHTYDETDRKKIASKKISESKKGKKTGPRPQWVKDKISATKVQRLAEREAERGYKQWSPEERARMAEERKGKVTNTPEASAKRSASMKKVWAEGGRGRAAIREKKIPNLYEVEFMDG